MKTRFMPYEDESHGLEKEHSGCSVDESRSSVRSTVRLQCAQSQNLRADRSQAAVCAESGLVWTRVRPECGPESGLRQDHSQASVWKAESNLTVDQSGLSVDWNQGSV